MEIWEAAVLIVGGVWLVGRMARNSPTSPLNQIAPSVSAVGTVGPQGNTTATNTDGSSSLIAGEPLTPSAPPLFVPRTVSVNAPGTAIARSPIVPGGGLHNNLMPVTAQAPSKFIDL